MEHDPPRFEARRAISWLVLFMTHVASCGAGAVIKNRNEPGTEFIDATDPEFRLKLAIRLGMARHSKDAAAMEATREPGGGKAEADSRDEYGSTPTRTTREARRGYAEADSRDEHGSIIKTRSLLKTSRATGGGETGRG